MAKRLIVSGIDGGSTGNTGYDYLQGLSYFLNGDAVGGSGVVDVAAGHLQVTESSPAAMTVDVKKGAVILRDNNADPFLKRAYIGVLESDSDGVGLVVAPNTSGNNRIDAVVAYADLSAATAARGLDQFVVTVVTGSGATALTDGALQTAVDALVTGYSDVPFTRLCDVTVADSASSIVNANLEDTRTQVILSAISIQAGSISVIQNATSTTPKASAYSDTEQTNIATTTPVQVVFGTENYDIGADFASSTYTVPATGYYRITAQIAFDDIATFLCTGWIYKNGAELVRAQKTSTDRRTTINLAYTAYLAATDTIKIYAQANTTGDVADIEAGAGRTFFNIEMI